MADKTKQRAQQIRMTAKERKTALNFLRAYIKEHMPKPLPRSSPYSIRPGSKHVNRRPISEY